ncbi:MAG: type I-U CRISPR-associated protein Cas7 [Gammaproteobacteria bacterium]|nr:type I-U CRISPR-associated protein Cas7 [Gammaproteobacteria bacterium]
MTKPGIATNETINQWAEDGSATVALVLKQKLLPVEGEGGIIFPPTYADIGYCVDELADGTKVAQIDSVGSQANRMEPIFKHPRYHDLVPQIEFTLGSDEDGTERRVSLLELAHRAGDAVVRSTTLADKIDKAFRDLLNHHDATALAKLAPTSLVFGAWDSRGTSVKRPRLVRSFIRAEDVEVLHSAAQYNSVWKMLSKEDKASLEKEAKAKKADLAVKGFKDVPSTFRKTNKNVRQFLDGKLNMEARVLGGVIANGPIYRNVTLNLVALRTLNGKANDNNNDDNTLLLRRYLLGLALVAATADMELYLREGCHLRYAQAAQEPWDIIQRRGEPEPVSITPEAAFDYAKAAATAFGVNAEKQQYPFDIKKAKALLLANKQDEEASAAG